MRKYFLAIMTIFAFSCNQKQDEKIIPVNITDTIVIKKEKSKEENQQIGDTISLSFKDDKGNYIAEGVIDSVHPRIYVKFTNDAVGNLKATVKPLGVGNIRFNQIIFPDKTADGPFSQDLEQKLNQTGVHTLIIGHSQMADNPYKGNFMIKVHVVAEE